VQSGGGKETPPTLCTAFDGPAISGFARTPAAGIYVYLQAGILSRRPDAFPLPNREAGQRDGLHPIWRGAPLAWGSLQGGKVGFGAKNSACKHP